MEFTRYAEWEHSVPEAITKDAPWRMEVYRLVLFAADLTESVTEHRLNLITQLVRLLLTIVPAERKMMKEEHVSYDTADISMLMTE